MAGSWTDGAQAAQGHSLSRAEQVRATVAPGGADRRCAGEGDRGGGGRRGAEVPEGASRAGLEPRGGGAGPTRGAEGGSGASWTRGAGGGRG